MYKIFMCFINLWVETVTNISFWSILTPPKILIYRNLSRFVDDILGLCMLEKRKKKTSPQKFEYSKNKLPTVYVPSYWIWVCFIGLSLGLLFLFDPHESRKYWNAPLIDQMFDQLLCIIRTRAFEKLDPEYYQSMQDPWSWIGLQPWITDKLWYE